MTLENSGSLRLPFELRGGALLAADTFAILILAFPVQVLIARYLGPAQLGVYSYVLSFANLARVFVSLSLQDVCVPMYQRQPSTTLFGSGWLLRQLLACGLTLVAFAWTLLQTQPDSREFGLLVTLAVAACQFADHEIFAVWCKAKGKLTDFVIVDFFGTLAGLALRLALVYSGGSMLALVGSYLGEQLAKTFLAGILYLRQQRPFWGCSRSEAGQILTTAWPIWTSALLTAGYARLDQIMLGHLLSDSAELGQYAVAGKLIEALTAASIALFVVYLPLLSSPQGQRHLQRYHDLSWLSCLLLVVPLSVLLKPLVLTMYGPPYQMAAELSFWALASLPTLHLGQCRIAYAFAFGHQKVELLLKIASLLLALALNWLLIPRYGARGALAASLAVQWGFLLLAYGLPVYRPLLPLVLNSLWLPGVWRRLRDWLKT